RPSSSCACATSVGLPKRTGRTLWVAVSMRNHQMSVRISRLGARLWSRARTRSSRASFERNPSELSFKRLAIAIEVDAVADDRRGDLRSPLVDASEISEQG